MKNAAEMALAEFNAPNIQLLVKDDGGTAQGAQQAAQQALDEGAEIILGPLFAHSVAAVGQLARARGIPVIAFSTDANVAARGVYLLSFLPESDVDRIVAYAISPGTSASFAALVPDNAYGTVVQAALPADGGAARRPRASRSSAIRRIRSRCRRRSSAWRRPPRRPMRSSSRTGPIRSPWCRALTAAGVNPRRMQLIGTGLWDDPADFRQSGAAGRLVSRRPEPAGYRNFATRYRTRFGRDPVRTATLAYDAVSLVAALVKTQGRSASPSRCSTNASGFSGIDGIFRFRADGTNERGLAVLRVAPAGGQMVSPAPKAFTGSGT